MRKDVNKSAKLGFNGECGSRRTQRKGKEMKRVVEITIDLTDSNCKPRIEAFGITKVGERNIYCKGKKVYEHGRRFFIPHLNEVRYRGFLKYTYRYQTMETDYVKIMESVETADALNKILSYLKSDMALFNKRMERNMEYIKVIQRGREGVKSIENWIKADDCGELVD